MTPTVTIVAMLLVTLGAALYVAWPLLFGRVRAEEYLAFAGDEPAEWSGASRASRASSSALADDDLDLEPSTRSQRGASGASRVDLDVEQEIEAFRRRARQSGAQASSLVCPTCGHPVKDPDAAFCSKCGAPVRKGAGQNKKKAGKSREDR
ncbi:MAG TPA: zinc ribbon domain-containing protein [Chloroflexota bacterium]